MLNSKQGYKMITQIPDQINQLFQISIITLIMLALSLPALAAERPFPVHNLSIAFDLENHQLRGSSNIELPAGESIELQLGFLSITSVKINGKMPEFDLDRGLLAIPSSPETQKIEISFAKSYPPDGFESLIDTDGIVLADIWHPLANREMVFKLTTTIPAGFVAVSEAEETIVFPGTPTATEKQVIFRFPYPLSVLHFIAGPYVVEEETFSDGKILSSFFFAEDQVLAKGYREKARSYLDRYEKLIGPYPYKRFAIVENRLPTGYAMPTFTLLGQAVVRLPFIKDTSLGHEVLHAWFGNSVRIDIEDGNWAEGLTAYLADHAFAQDQDLGSTFRKEQLVKYRSYVHGDDVLPLKKFTGAADELSTKYTIRAIGYSKGSMFFHMLKNTVGEETFLAALRDFYSRMKHRSAGWSDLLASFEKESHIKLKAFFDQWLTRTDLPSLTVRQLEVDESSGQPLLSFQLVQKNTPPYQLTVPILIKTTQKQITKKITVADKETFINLPLTATPTELIIDAGYDLMRELSLSELPPTWSRFAGAPNKLAIIEATDGANEIFAPFIDLLQGMNCRIVRGNNVTDAELSASAVIFLGTGGTISRSLFAQPVHPASGLTVDIRNNPLNQAEVAVLVSSQDREETALAIHKLSHYGKYSYLNFKKGQIQEKRITETDAGLRFPLLSMPAGIPVQASQPFKEIIHKLLENRIVYVGETHTSYADHNLQLRIIKALYKHDPHLAVGMEMFSRPTQPVLNDYIAGKIDEKTFLKRSKYFKQWSFDYRLYRNIINFARRHHLPVIALNLEKKVVSSIFKSGGTDTLSKEEKEELIKDRNLDMPGYRERLAEVYQLHSTPGNEAENHFSGFVQAQALWDETMAESIVEYLKTNPDDRMVVMAGRGHTLKDTAIPPRVNRRMPVRQAVVVNSDGNPADPETADFLFFSSPESLPPPVLLGVMLEETDDGNGVTVADLSPQGQAKAAGIKKNDIIVAIDGESVNTIEDVKIIMLYKERGDSVKVSVNRPHALFSDEQLEIEVSLAEKKQAH